MLGKLFPERRPMESIVASSRLERPALRLKRTGEDFVGLQELGPEGIRKVNLVTATCPDYPDDDERDDEEDRNKIPGMSQNIHSASCAYRYTAKQFVTPLSDRH
jgi:hypothetical protein